MQGNFKDIKIGNVTQNICIRKDLQLVVKVAINTKKKNATKSLNNLLPSMIQNNKLEVKFEDLYTKIFRH